MSTQELIIKEIENLPEPLQQEDVFPNTESVNRALRLLADTAESATARKGLRRKAPNSRLKRSA